MMRRSIGGLVLAAIVLAMAAAAQTVPDPEQQHRLAEQKLKLVEMLVNSPAAQASAASSDDLPVPLRPIRATRSPGSSRKSA